MPLLPVGIVAARRETELPVSSVAVGLGTSQTIHKLLVTCSGNMNVALAQANRLGIFSVCLLLNNFQKKLAFHKLFTRYWLHVDGT